MVTQLHRATYTNTYGLTLYCMRGQLLVVSYHTLYFDGCLQECAVYCDLRIRKQILANIPYEQMKYTILNFVVILPHAPHGNLFLRGNSITRDTTHALGC